MASNKNQVQKSLGEQMADLLRRKPKNFDVTFSVGPDKIKVEAVQFILKAASPVFEREFDENWKTGVVTDTNGIPLPNEDPTAFQIFVNLLILDAWSSDYIKSLKLSPNNLLNLLGLCRRYEITKAIQNIEEAADDFIQWADNQCKLRGMKPTGENHRKVLGASLFQIRFPTMTVEQFTKIGLLKKNVLNAEEKLAIYEYIGLKNQKNHHDKSRLSFKTNRRTATKSNRSKKENAQAQTTTDTDEVNTSCSSGFSVLLVTPEFKLKTFVCDGSLHERISYLVWCQSHGQDGRY